MLTAGTCDTMGACKAESSACPNNLACNQAGAACLTDCSTTFDCAAGTYCNAGICKAKEATGTCTEDDDCTSGILWRFWADGAGLLLHRAVLHHGCLLWGHRLLAHRSLRIPG